MRNGSESFLDKTGIKAARAWVVETYKHGIKCMEGLQAGEGGLGLRTVLDFGLWIVFVPPSSLGPAGDCSCRDYSEGEPWLP